ncbi:uncharacterized protein [Narcine bancroftii]|uniref:uncharacterized protein n=1 Tax=Narcine bancroftii TaxID=1343680 RepID=UPI003831B51B
MEIKEELIAALEQIKIDKSSGPDIIFPLTLREASVEITGSFSMGEVLEDWKVAHLVLLFKKGSKGKPDNYSSVSMMSIIGKLLEWVQRDRIFKYLDSNGMIKDSQHSFVHGIRCQSLARSAHGIVRGRWRPWPRSSEAGGGPGPGRSKREAVAPVRAQGKHQRPRSGQRVGRQRARSGQKRREGGGLGRLKAIVLQSTEEVLGFSSRKNKDWFNENSQEIQELLAKKRAAHQAHLTKPSWPEKKQAFRRACSHLQRKLREIQNEWWTSLAKRTKLSVDIGDFRGFYEALKAVYGPSPQVQSPLRSSDGKVLLSDKISIFNRWSEHFQSLFSANCSVQESALLQLPQHPLRLELDEVLTQDETYKANEQLKSGKAAGMDGIPPEVWKAGSKTACQTEFFKLCWDQGKLPQDLRDATIITLYKNKGEKSDCSNYRGITLLSIEGKIFARILLN